MRRDLSATVRILLYLIFLVSLMPVRILIASEGVQQIVGFAVPVFVVGMLVAMLRRTKISEASDQLWIRFTTSLFSMITGLLGGGWLMQFSVVKPQMVAWVSLLTVAVGVVLLRTDRQRHGTGDQDEQSKN